MNTGHNDVTFRFCNYMEMVFSPMLFLQTLASSLIICLVGLQVTTASITKISLKSVIILEILSLYVILLAGISRKI